MAYDLAEAERLVDPATSIDRLRCNHLFAAHFVLESALTGLQSGEKLLFHPGNIIRHLRFPHNYYVAALMRLSDAQVPGGTAFGAYLHRMIDMVVEASTGHDFLERIIRQHAHHVNARYSIAAGDPGKLARLAKSSDVNDRRMVLIGLALRSNAPQTSWDALFDAMRKDEFNRSILAFDALHYADNEPDRDGLRMAPARIRQTALRYFVELAAPDPNKQLFAARRLLNMFEHATPAMIREADLGTVARATSEASRGPLPPEAAECLNRVKGVDDESR